MTIDYKLFPAFITFITFALKNSHVWMSYDMCFGCPITCQCCDRRITNGRNRRKVACEASVSVEFSALKGPFPYFEYAIYSWGESNKMGDGAAKNAQTETLAAQAKEKAPV